MPGLPISGLVMPGLGIPGSPEGLVAPGDSLGIIGVVPDVLGIVSDVEYSLVVVSVVEVSLFDLLSLPHAASSMAALPTTASAILGPEFIRTLTSCLPGFFHPVGKPAVPDPTRPKHRLAGRSRGRDWAMSVIGTAKDQLVGLVENLIGPVSHGSAQQSVTVACTVVEAEDFWRDPHRLSVVLGEFGDVQFTAPDRYRWLLHFGEHELDWESTLFSAPGRLRFSDEAGAELVVLYRAAPHGLGTEMTLRASLPTPALLNGAAAFTVLYRARALLQTGEVPTIARNPSGRQ